MGLSTIAGEASPSGREPRRGDTVGLRAPGRRRQSDTNPLIAGPGGMGEPVGDPSIAWHYPTRSFGPSQQVEYWCAARRSATRARSTAWSTPAAPARTTTRSSASGNRPACGRGSGRARTPPERRRRGTPAVVVSMHSCSERRPTPRSASPEIVSTSGVASGRGDRAARRQACRLAQVIEHPRQLGPPVVPCRW
jgi:hypothetical protein